MMHLSFRARVTTIGVMTLALVLGTGSWVTVRALAAASRADTAAQNTEVLDAIASQIVAGTHPQLLALPIAQDGTELVIFDGNDVPINFSVSIISEGFALPPEQLPAGELPPGLTIDGTGTLIDVFTGEPVPFGTAIIDGGVVDPRLFPITPAGFEPLSNVDPNDWLRTTQIIEAPDGGVFTLAAATPIETVTRGITRLALVLAIVIPLLVLLGGLSLWLALGAALRPVRLISDEAERIAPSNSGRRLPVPDSGDEIAALTRTLNDMLDRLDSGLVRQRQFVSDASHELRSPLTAVKASAELALLDATIGPSTNESLEAVQRGASRLEEVLDDLTQLASDETSSMVPTDIDELVMDLVAESRQNAEHLIFDTTSLSPVLGEVHPTRLARAVRNLLDNACRHAFSTIAVSTAMAAGHVAIIVEDDGPGVSIEQREAIFERFVRLDEGRSRAGGGSGLGLALVATIAADHMGEVACDASPLGGARFTLILRSLLIGQPYELREKRTLPVKG